MSLTADQVRWVAHLSRLQLSDAEVAQMTPQLASIVGYVDQLQKINTDGVEPLVHALEQVNVFRQDELGTSLSPEEALANAPERIGNFFQVPAVLD
ncbi:MAG: Asp-tRNA(Asn)/Glu-tRNA(Gln) amidotransferase subunit GatC [Planctomycetota bacterium]|nr:Asp-tRNA(Asn)/Glu-tRNA(Gln) amidotransferase subunit GatC [Planctomycetota bacterium]RLT18753.1 MAG: Asp-tRNA(Asn)/Glu-tRNA(Gln) amidotransferase subunit GatC [Planctomycetota bacterium]